MSDLLDRLEAAETEVDRLRKVMVERMQCARCGTTVGDGEYRCEECVEPRVEYDIWRCNICGFYAVTRDWTAHQPLPHCPNTTEEVTHADLETMMILGPAFEVKVDE